MRAADAKKEAARIKREVGLPRAWKSAALLPYGVGEFHGDEFQPGWERGPVKLTWNVRWGFEARTHGRRGTGLKWELAVDALRAAILRDARRLEEEAREVLLTTTRG